MRLIVAIHIIAIAMATCSNANALEYDVDMPNSGDAKIQVIRITIEGCETKFKVKTEDFEKFSKNEDAMTDLVKKAVSRSATGCSKD